MAVRVLRIICDHGGSHMRLPRRAAARDEGLRRATLASRPRVAQRLGAALLVDQGAHERPRTPIACPVEDRLSQRAGGAADARTVAIVGA